MNCINCGTAIPPESNFCTYCGRSAAESRAPIPQELVGQKDLLPMGSPAPPYFTPEGAAVADPSPKGRVPWLWPAIAILLAAACLLLLLFPRGGGKDNGVSPGFATEEEAITHTMTLLGELDYQGILDASCNQEKAENFDLAAQAERMQAIMPYNTLLSAEHESYWKINQLSLDGYMTGELQRMTLSMINAEELAPLYEGLPIHLKDYPFTTEEIVAAMDPSGLTELEILRMDRIPMHLKARELAKKQSGVYRADDSSDWMVFYRFGGDTYMVSLTLYQYNGRWKISSFYGMGGAIASIGPGRIAVPITEREYFEILDKIDRSLGR